MEEEFNYYNTTIKMEYIEQINRKVELLNQFLKHLLLATTERDKKAFQTQINIVGLQIHFLIEKNILTPKYLEIEKLNKEWEQLMSKL
jgi:hypothetical protein